MRKEATQSPTLLSASTDIIFLGRFIECTTRLQAKRSPDRSSILPTSHKHPHHAEFDKHSGYHHQWTLHPRSSHSRCQRSKKHTIQSKRSRLIIDSVTDELSIHGLSFEVFIVVMVVGWDSDAEARRAVHKAGGSSGLQVRTSQFQ